MTEDHAHIKSITREPKQDVKGFINIDVIELKTGQVIVIWGDRVTAYDCMDTWKNGGGRMYGTIDFWFS